MKTTLDMGKVLEGYIYSSMPANPMLHQITHWDCQDTDGDGEVECYFYVNSKKAKYHGVKTLNEMFAHILGVEPTDMIEDDKEMGHEGEYRFEYIVSLKSEETLDFQR